MHTTVCTKCYSLVRCEDGETDLFPIIYTQYHFHFRNANDETPFHLAASHGHADLVEYLVGVNRSCIELRDYQVELS